MKKKIMGVAPGLVLALTLFLSVPQARADFWGADLAYLAQILAESIQQVTQLEAILGNGKDSLQFMRDLNRGNPDAMALARTMNQTLKPGNLNFSDMSELIRELERIYGKVPATSEAHLQGTNDMTVAESIQLHNDAFRYADEVDPEAERIKDHAEDASPQGAARAGLQAQGVQIHVLNQILRMNAALLKVQSEQLAMQNRKAKLQSEQFRQQYGELAQSLTGFEPGFDLPSLSGSY